MTDIYTSILTDMAELLASIRYAKEQCLALQSKLDAAPFGWNRAMIADEIAVLLDQHDRLKEQFDGIVAQLEQMDRVSVIPAETNDPTFRSAEW